MSMQDYVTIIEGFSGLIVGGLFAYTILSNM